MSPVKRPTKKKVAAATPENQTPSDLIASAIVARYSDLAPSVNRIMQAGLDEAGQLHAITLFQESLSTPGDAMRRPDNAIAAGRSLVASKS